MMGRHKLSEKSKVERNSYSVLINFYLKNSNFKIDGAQQIIWQTKIERNWKKWWDAKTKVERNSYSVLIVFYLKNSNLKNDWTQQSRCLTPPPYLYHFHDFEIIQFSVPKKKKNTSFTLFHAQAENEMEFPYQNKKYFLFYV